MTNKAIDLVQLRQSIVSDGQDDYYGLYEVVWGLNAQYPHTTEAEKRSAVQEVVRGLLNEGAVVLYRTRWGTDTYEALRLSEAVAVLTDAKCCDAPDQRAYICYAAS